MHVENRTPLVPSTPVPLPALAPEQMPLRPPLPTVIGNIDYLEFEAELQRMDRVLIASGVQAHYVSTVVALAEKDAEERVRAGLRQSGLSTGDRAFIQKNARHSLRCNILRFLLGEDFRGLSRRLAEAPLFQWFCEIDRIDVVKVPSKSALQRYSRDVPEATLRALIQTLTAAGAAVPQAGEPQQVGLKAPLDLEEYFLDTTCLKLNIHFPVDWVLLRDAARTLIKAILVIRKHGLKSRMPRPEDFLNEMNRLCIEMTQTSRQGNGKKAKKERKRILREMKKLSHTIRKHAERYRTLLEERWKETDLSEGDVQQITGRIDNILQKLPQAIKQAHERIIGQRPVPDGKKILSLYESHAEVYVRGKADARVEFGSQLLLGEQRQGVILDWVLVQGEVRADAQLLADSLSRLETFSGYDRIKVTTGDRGFDSKANRILLEKKKLQNGICPKAPGAMAERRMDVEFRDLQKRRSQTEARIAILKNVFTGNPILSKGAANQAQDVAWAVLTHNLWVIVRLPRAAPPPAVPAS